MQPRRVAVVGASSDRRKFGNISVRAHAAAGWHVYPIHPSESQIENWPVFPSVDALPIDQLDRITLYLPPQRITPLLESFAAKAVKEVWFNPGTDSPEVLEAARALGLKIIRGCSIIDVGFSPSQFSE